MIRVSRNVNPGGLVKFQLFDAEADKGKPHYDWVKAHELTFEQAKELFDYGASIGQEVFFSVFAPEFVDWCERIGVQRYKLASGMIENSHLFKAVIDTGKNVFVSFDQPNIESDYHITNLYCPSCYPQSGFVMPNFIIPQSGFSDHCVGIDYAKIALARGAGIVEKHFCLKHNPDFPDDPWSMTPAELTELVKWEKICHAVL